MSPLHCPPRPDECWCLQLPGVRHRLLLGGHLRLLHYPRDQKQNFHGNQPHVLQEAAHRGHPGPHPGGPAAAEEDERLRRPREHIPGLRQLFVLPQLTPRLSLWLNSITLF